MLGGCAEPLPPTPTDYRCFGGFGSVVWVFVGWGVGLFGVAFEGRMCVVCFVGVLANGFGFLLANGFVS